MTTALGRDTVIPVLRPNEAILFLVLAGLALHHLWIRRSFFYTGLDVAISIFAVGCALIPWLVLTLSRADMDFDSWRAVLGPLQFLLIYLCFAQLRVSDDDLKRLLNLTLAVSMIIGTIAILELLDLPSGARALFNTYVPPDHPLSPFDPIYRPTSTLGTYGAVAAFATLNFILALTLSNRRASRLSQGWLNAVMVLNLGALIASLTWSPAAALLLGAATVMWYLRYLPRQIWVGAAAMVIALIIMWPAVSNRIDQQTGLGSIATVDARFLEWKVFFLPALAEHVWFGTGTVIPSELPAYLSNYVDTAYLRMGFRAGLVGLGLLISMLSVVGVYAWRCRESADPWRRRLGAIVLATVVTIIITGFTGEYLTYGGLSQYIAMMFGLLAARLRQPLESAGLAGGVTRWGGLRYGMASAS